MTTPSELRALLLAPEQAAAMEAPYAGDKDAAVLIPLYLDRGELHAVLTKRRDDLKRHAGEISFPGGTPDYEGETMEQTALREAEEEIGLPRAEVELVGALPPVGTFVTGYKIHPFVGVIRAGHAWRPQPTEVEIVLEVSLPALRGGYELKRLLRKGVPIRTPTYTLDGQHVVWGATARIVQSLLERLAPVLEG